MLYRIDPETGDKTRFLDIPDNQIGVGSERGVLGVAFAPDYKDTGRFFVYMVNADNNIEVREYHHTDGHAKADPDPVQTIITIPHPDFKNHNGARLSSARMAISISAPAMAAARRSQRQRAEQGSTARQNPANRYQWRRFSGRRQQELRHSVRQCLRRQGRRR